MDEYLYVVEAKYSDEIFTYEYGNLTHALVHYNDVKEARILRYKQGQEVCLHEYCKGCFRNIKLDWSNGSS